MTVTYGIIVQPGMPNKQEHEWKERCPLLIGFVKGYLCTKFILLGIGGSYERGKEVMDRIAQIDGLYGTYVLPGPSDSVEVFNSLKNYTTQNYSRKFQFATEPTVEKNAGHWLLLLPGSFGKRSEFPLNYLQTEKPMSFSNFLTPQQKQLKQKISSERMLAVCYDPPLLDFKCGIDVIPYYQYQQASFSVETVHDKFKYIRVEQSGYLATLTRAKKALTGKDPHEFRYRSQAKKEGYVYMEKHIGNEQLLQFYLANKINHIIAAAPVNGILSAHSSYGKIIEEKKGKEQNHWLGKPKSRLNHTELWCNAGHAEDGRALIVHQMKDEGYYFRVGSDFDQKERSKIKVTEEMRTQPGDVSSLSLDDLFE